MIPFDIAYIFEDIDDIYWAWSYLLSSLLDDHAPIKRKTAKREHVPFMTPELLEAIRKRNKLKRLYNKSKSPLDWDRYKTYCSAIWNNCKESDKQKLERLNVRALRCVYNKRVPLHGDDDYGLTLYNRRLQDIAILIFKAVNGMLPGYISDLFVVRNNVKCLRGTNKLVVPRKKTTNFGLKSTTFVGAKVWNILPDKLRLTKILKEFKKAVRELHL